MKRAVAFWALTLALGTIGSAYGQGASILVQSTTSTANSGLYDHLLPEFEREEGIRVDVVAVGTGQAIRNARNCDGDVLLVHAKDQEVAFVADGMGVERFDLMYNDFVLVGPVSDPAGISGMADAQEALKRVAEAEKPFASRGDASGTHSAEMALWADAGVNPMAASGAWYRETGSGMGATLNTAVGMEAYALTDRATWVSFANKADFEILVEGDEDLVNQYGVILVNPRRCPSVDAAAGQAFVDWLLSEDGQSVIAEFRVDGQQLFFPNAQD
ncbi:substrate-binding domain-containing protein [Roseitranquillus sediminis]|uniref:substrate-binding domain-containing protein n=1 Tax=Roseitranquillus sediminis TaxID=2809051 RepID=UPI001D0C6332|nr:substrate-binding domain-containing protein [Roseitranquillus sediminis]MBM9594774.1 substrate-binding domain-containing protein [Roseitranquillus sediminis]